MRIVCMGTQAAWDAFDFSKEAGSFQRNLWARLCAKSGSPRELTDEELQDVNAAGTPDFSVKPEPSDQL